MTSFVLLAYESSDRVSKEFENRQPNRIGRLRIGLKAIRGFKTRKAITEVHHKQIIYRNYIVNLYLILGHLTILD
jgi:hypothetical protein